MTGKPIGKFTRELRAVADPRLRFALLGSLLMSVFFAIHFIRIFMLAPILARRLSRTFRKLDFGEKLAGLARAESGVVDAPGGAARVPYFCSGCPHNTSTKVPDGSRALAGIGCHFMIAAPSTSQPMAPISAQVSVG